MIDRLIEKIEKTGNPSVAGLDPTYEMIPEKIKKEMLGLHGKTPKAVAEMFIAFNKGLIDCLFDIIPAVKPQIAMYEKYGLEGIRAYIETINYAKAKGLIVIGDIKRGDISSTAAAYAAHLEGADIEGERFDLWNTDAVTLNPYMGFDAIEPFIKPCNDLDKGVFILVRTSNPSSKQLQDLQLHAGALGASERFGRVGAVVYEEAARLVSEWGKLVMGKNGYSKIGAVVGAGAEAELKRGRTGGHISWLRKIMPHTFFLIPGYGAQGGAGRDIRGFFDKYGGGCIVNSSRGIIAAYQNSRVYSDDNFGEAARAAALNMRDDIKGYN